MSSEHRSRSETTDGRTVLKAGARFLADLLIISLWVLLLTLGTLTIGGPRWAFYIALLGGVGLYVQFTASWW